MHEVLFGLLGGTLIGSIGIGSGSLLTPLLIMAGHRPTVAVSTGLATLIVSKLTGSIAHRSLGNWPGRPGWFVIAGGVLGVAAVSSLALAGVSPSETFVRRAVAVSLVVTAIAMLVGERLARLRRTSRPALGGRAGCPAVAGETPAPQVLFLSGAIVGGFVALTSAGSGSLLVPLLLIATAWGVPQLAATSNVFGWVAALLAFALQLGQRSFDPALFVLVLAGLVPGVIAGVLLSHRIDRRVLAPLLSIFTLYLAIQLF